MEESTPSFFDSLMSHYPFDVILSWLSALCDYSHSSSRELVDQLQSAGFPTSKHEIEQITTAAVESFAATANSFYQSIPFAINNTVNTNITGVSAHTPIHEPIFNYTFIKELNLTTVVPEFFENITTSIGGMNVTDLSLTSFNISQLMSSSSTFLPIEITLPNVDVLLTDLAEWYLLIYQHAIVAVMNVIESMELHTYDTITLYCIVAALFIFIVYPIYNYYTHLCAPIRIYSQHLPGSATQLPPSNVHIDTTATGGGVHAVWKTVAENGSGFMEFLRQGYKPTPWMALPNLSGHLQTLFTARAPPSWLGTPLVTYKREIIPVTATSPYLLPGEVALDWGVLGLARRSTNDVQEWHARFHSNTPTVLICHGLAGGSSEHYVKNLIFHLSSVYGYRCVVFNARGCGGSKIINRQLYCGAYTDDLRQVVASLRSRLPGAPLLGIGFSLGSNILTKFVGEEGLNGRPPPFTAMASIANPFDFLIGSHQLERNWFQKTIYSANLAKNLIALFRSHLDGLEENQQKDLVGAADDSMPQYDLNSVYSSPTLREFDKRLTRVIFGYATVDDYYRDCSSSRYVKFLRCPALLLNSLDDPISPRTAIPYDEASINPYVTLLTTEAGGHSMDWYQGWWNVNSWAAKAIGKYFNSIVENTPGLSGHISHGEKVSTPPPRTPLTHAPIRPMMIDSQAAESALESLRLAASPQREFPIDNEIALAESVDAAVELQTKLLQLESVLAAAGAGIQTEDDNVEQCQSGPALFDQDTPEMDQRQPQ